MSATQAEFLDNRPVAGDVFGREIVQQLPTLADQCDQRTLCVVVFAVLLQVLSQVSNAEGEHGDLPFG